MPPQHSLALPQAVSPRAGTGLKGPSLQPGLQTRYFSVAAQRLDLGGAQACWAPGRAWGALGPRGEGAPRWARPPAAQRAGQDPRAWGWAGPGSGSGVQPEGERQAGRQAGAGWDTPPSFRRVQRP